MFIKNVIANAGSAAFIPKSVRRHLLRLAGANIKKARVSYGVKLFGDMSRLTLDDGVFINVGSMLFPTGGIDIGENVAIGPGVIIMTGTHQIGSAEKRATSPATFSPVRIGKGAWLGAGVIVQAGVTIGSGAIVMNGAVVTADLAPNAIYAGVPAKLVRVLVDSQHVTA